MDVKQRQNIDNIFVFLGKQCLKWEVKREGPKPMTLVRKQDRNYFKYGTNSTREARLMEWSNGTIIKIPIMLAKPLLLAFLI